MAPPPPKRPSRSTPPDRILRRGGIHDGPGSAQHPSRGFATRRTAEAQGADPAYIPYVPEQPDENTPRDLVEAHDYYLTPRAQHPNAKNKQLFAKSISRIFTFDAFHLVEDLFTAPLLIVAGSEAGSLWMSTELHGRVRSPKKLVVVEGGAHMDFYDVPKYVDHAVAEATPFFRENLGAHCEGN
ncbi:alpha/beta hydrolase [Rhodococcus opacus]|uniref:alpha/beta hydrolase n=1 Tax=Rhodococcus TaxID=1827 RepID=UPI0002A3D571|nr:MULTISPECIES: alpha/beta hydrolase [Rhodococcus]ELB89821.1 peptidase S15 [Rhodococcus wratislaviensis IFP 2016]MDI9938722.1 alpha/beta hydrolase [Rhodococcus sp. IEGM 1351]MDX5965189.1 alpha/beta hydrolase [Rhodococcus opacus]UZG52693.1 alpha/beta hydrolase [Rhodococcus opacus]CAG7619874.1 hypothetical protein E143388_06201 [Rhodococcus opacus]